MAVAKTPMMKQYQEIKSQYPDTILFFRLGDFYEMFNEDALLASRELEITLTGRDAGTEERVPMCGVPYHAADVYIARLIQKGHKVAICEQVEDPRLCKGIVKREVIRVVTPGTTLEPSLQVEASNNYLAAVYLEQQAYGLAFCDVSTGEFWLCQFNGPEGKAVLQEELIRINPAEILIPQLKDPEEEKAALHEPVLDLPEPTKMAETRSANPEANREANNLALTYRTLNNLRMEEELLEYRKILASLDKTAITYYQKQAFQYGNALALLENHFQENFPRRHQFEQRREAIAAAGAILRYLQETQKAAPQQIKKLQLYHPEAYLAIDATTFRNLELTKTLRYGERKGSLLDLLDKTKTACGARLLQLWLQKPLTDKNMLERRLDAVETLSQHWSERQKIRACLEKVYDLERLMTRILYGRANPKELIAFKHSIAVLPELDQLLANFHSCAYLATLKEELDLLEDMRHTLETAIEDDPPLNLKDGGVIKAGYHQQIDELREISINGKEWIARLENKEKENTGIKSLKIGFNKVFGYYFEVTKANLSLVPDYFQRKQTLANGERYVTEELLRLESQVLGAEEKLIALEETLYSQLLKDLGQYAKRVQDSSYVLAQLDVLQSLGEVAVQNGYVRPQLLEMKENELEIEELRHPVVEKMLSEATYVPNDLVMPEDTDFYIITGPNMGGKSTYCRSVALAVIMAQMGSFVPAKKAIISLRDRVFARVGASDDLRSGQSTFMVEMNEVANILNHASKHSLVILDEVGRGTSTYDGLSMAWAVSEYLIREIAAKTLFATHYHELTRLSTLYQNVKNLAVSVQEKGDELIFLHKIISGAADKSYGIQVAILAGLPGSVINRAKEILKKLEKEKENAGQTSVLSANCEARRAVDEKNAPQHVNQGQISLLDEYQRQLTMLNEEREQFISGKNAQLQALEKALLELDLYEMTPLDALNKLYELQQQVKKNTALDKRKII